MKDATEEVNSENWYGKYLTKWEEQGWDISAIEGFLNSKSDSKTENIMRLEFLITSAEALQERLSSDWLDKLDIDGGLFDQLKNRLTNPLDYDSILEEYQLWARKNRKWELVLEKFRPYWEGVGKGKERWLIIARCDSLDDSSKARLNLILPLLEDPQNIDEIEILLSEIESNEARQKRIIYATTEDLVAEGYNVSNITAMPLIDAIDELAKLQEYRNEIELIRLRIIDEIAKFDDKMAEEYEAKRKLLIADVSPSNLANLAQDIEAMSADLNSRLVDINLQLSAWNEAGFVFDKLSILPADLFEWETNLPEMILAINRHLEVKEKYLFFKSRWPEIDQGEAYLGYLSQTDQLADIVENLNLKWQDYELECLSIIERYQARDLQMDDWSEVISSDPQNALKMIKAKQILWDSRLECIDELSKIDVSFEGRKTIEDRIALLREIDASEEIITDTKDLIRSSIIRRTRHRRLLESELLELIGQGKAPSDAITVNFNLKEFENFVAQARKYGSSNSVSKSANSVIGGEIGDRIKQKISQELSQYATSGWYVDELLDIFSNDPMLAAKLLGTLRNEIANHATLRKRLSAMPWNRDIALALTIQEEMQNPLKLKDINDKIPKFMTELAQREIEDEDFIFTAWKPKPVRKTLLPIPEQIEPIDSLGDAHEAMLEAMDRKSEEDAEDSEISHNNEGGLAEATPEEVARPPESDEQTPNWPKQREGFHRPSKDPRYLESMSDEEFFAEDKWSIERWSWWRERQKALEMANKEQKIDGQSESKEDSSTPTQRLQPTMQSNEVDIDNKAINNLQEFMKEIGLQDAISKDLATHEQVAKARKLIAKNVGIEPRDVRIDRMLRLVLRLLPKGNDLDIKRNILIDRLSRNLSKYKNWVKLRLESRHNTSSDNLLADSVKLGKALDRIPGPGFRVPLSKDDFELPNVNDLEGLESFVNSLIDSLNIDSASGIVAATA